MKTHMSPSERLLRLLFTLLVSILYSTKMIEGELLLILGIIATIFFISAISGFRPLLAFFGYSHRKKRDIF